MSRAVRRSARARRGAGPRALRAGGPRVRPPRGGAAPPGVGGRRRGPARRCTWPPRKAGAARRLLPRGRRRRGRRPARLDRAAGGDVRGRRVQRADGRRCSPAGSRCRTSPRSGNARPGRPVRPPDAGRRDDRRARGHRAGRRLRRRRHPHDRASATATDYVVNGTKTFITSGVRADFVTTAVRTGGPGHGGVSLLVVEKGTPGFTVDRSLAKMGWHCSDTAELVVRRRARARRANLVGEENTGFDQIAEQFVVERIALAVHAYGIAARCARAHRGVLPRARDVRQAADRQPGGAAQARRDAPAGRGRPRLHPRRRRRRHVAGESVIAEACLAKQTAVRRVRPTSRPGRAAARRHRLPARDRGGAALPRRPDPAASEEERPRC